MEDLGFISMMVLLVKQVHLQNVGAAIHGNARSVRGFVQGETPAVVVVR